MRQTPPIHEQAAAVVETFYDIGRVTAVREIFGGFTNRSFGVRVEKDGATTDVFVRRYKADVDIGEIRFEHRLIDHAIENGLRQVAAVYADLLRGLTYDRIAALPYAALRIGTAVSLHTGDPLIYPRKEVKTYGTKAAIEGLYRPGERVVLLDDLATTGGSKIEAAEKLRAAGLIVEDVVVLIDRQSGAREELARHGLRLHAAFTLSDLLAFWESQGLVPREPIEAVRRWLTAWG